MAKAVDDAAARLLQALIDEGDDHREDEERRSPLDYLIAEALHKKDMKVWSDAIDQLLPQLPLDKSNLWEALEYFTAMTEIVPQGSSEFLETIVSENLCDSPTTRLSIYGFLTLLGKPPTATSLISDLTSRKSCPSRWLDLMLHSLPNHTERRKIILEMIQSRELTVEDLAARLDEIRAASGSRLGDWIYEIERALPIESRQGFGSILSQAFGLPTAASQMPSVSSIPAMQNHIGLLRATKHAGSDLENEVAA